LTLGQSALGEGMSAPTVIAVASDSAHNIIKPVRETITLVEGLGVEGDAHAGKTVQHRYDKRRNPDAVIEVTGLRNPCKHLNQISPGLLKACLSKHEDGEPFPQSGIMVIILKGGDVESGDAIQIITPPEPHERLKAV